MRAYFPTMDADEVIDAVTLDCVEALGTAAYNREEDNALDDLASTLEVLARQIRNVQRDPR